MSEHRPSLSGFRCRSTGERYRLCVLLIEAKRTGGPPLRIIPALLLILLAGSFAGERCSGAATIWNGPLITFTEPAGGSGSNPADQDRITSDIWLTRNQIQGLFNAAQESSYTHFSSPAGTEWAYGSLANYATLQFANWETWNGHNPPSMVDQPAVLHLIPDNIYLSVEFLSWGGNAGGFSYERSTPLAVPEPSGGGLLVLALGGALLFRSTYSKRAVLLNVKRK